MKYVICIFLLGFLIISCSPSKKTEDPLVQQLPEAEVFTISKDTTAISFLPENYLQFAYFDNAAITYEKFTHNDFYTKLKDNYLFLDFKYNFAEDRDMFFAKFNFDFNSIFSYIEKDALLGITNNSFFLVASISFKSKLITSVLNIAPQSVIQKSKKRNYTIYHIRKGSESIFYSVVNEYIIFADSEMTLMDSVDAAERNLNEARNYTERVNDNELIYVKKINSANNPFDLFPVLSEIEILYNTQTEAISYVGLPEDKGEVGEILVDRYSHQTLKYLDPELPLVFYNSSYDFISILKSIASNKNSNTLSSNSQKIDE
ncbi:MAG: hypothetical protein GY756_27145, partial [bacterium]|nr:hypothetical protein [bacterium]